MLKLVTSEGHEAAQARRKAAASERLMAAERAFEAYTAGLDLDALDALEAGTPCPSCGRLVPDPTLEKLYNDMYGARYEYEEGYRREEGAGIH